MISQSAADKMHAIDNWYGLITHGVLALVSGITLCRVVGIKKQKFMKTLLTCILGTMLTATLFTAASLDIIHFGYSNNKNPPFWFRLVKFMGLYVNWVCIYLIQYLVSFKYYQTAEQVLKIEQ